ncbi:MAG TPA: TetR/AcrR family transcriptional regulator [Aliidongia sp.]|nr:TetR/AcrR family transcriptional regulator [Aliidongia sp.]
MPDRDPLKPRKTPRQSRAAETVAAILEAAARILEKDGPALYTTNRIAERAGVSIGSLYQYFPAKDAVTIALIEREAALLRTDIEAARQETDWRTVLGRMIGAAVRHQLRRPALARVLDFEEARLPRQPESGQRLSAVHGAIVEALGRSPELAGADRDRLAFDLQAMTRGITDAAGERGETDAADLEARVARAVFGYLGQPPATP